MSGSDSRPVSASRRRAGQSRSQRLVVARHCRDRHGDGRCHATGQPAAGRRPSAGRAGRLARGPRAAYRGSTGDAAARVSARRAAALPPASQQQPAAVASTPASPQTLPPAKSVQPTAAMSKSTALPPSTARCKSWPSSTASRSRGTELGRECIRRYGEEVLESMVNRQLIADAVRKRDSSHRRRCLGRNRQAWPAVLACRAIAG